VEYKQAVKLRKWKVKEEFLIIIDLFQVMTGEMWHEYFNMKDT